MKNVRKLVIVLLVATSFSSICQAQEAEFVLGYSCVGFHRIRLSDKTQNYRIASFRSLWDFDEKPPTSVRVSGGGEVTRKYIYRGVETERQRVKQTPLRSLANGVFVLLVVPSLLGALIFLLCTIFFIGQKEFLRMFLCFAICCVVLFGLSSYAGSKFYIDNATDKTLEVRIDGKFNTVINPKSFFKRRIGGRNVKIEVLDNGTMIETADIKLDKNFGHSLLRLWFGRGVIIYNIGAANKYHLYEVKYGS